MRITHLGHSCLLLEIADSRILVDPGNYSDFLDQARDLDAIVVTHQHPDHLDPDRFEHLIAANPSAQVFTDPQSAELVAQRCEPQVLRPGTFAVGQVQLTAVGDKHAYNHEWAPTVDNSGVVFRADGEPVLFHPGDALDADPGTVDLLAVPINAPWAAVRDTISFARRIGAPRIIPIHDALLSAAGRAMYIGHVQRHGGDDLEVCDMTDAPPRVF